MTERWIGRRKSFGRDPRLADPVAVLCCLAVLALYGWYDWTDPRRPLAAVPNDGWWAFSDQGRYLASTLAWATGDLRASQHWYLPGYPLLGVPFVHLTPSNPFLLPDAALLAGSLWLTAGIAAELAPAWRWARAIGAGSFLAVTALPATLEIWVTPWTTSAAAFLTLAGLLLVLRGLRRPGAFRLPFMASGCAGLLAAVRPVDAALLGSLVAGAEGVRLAVAWPGWKPTFGAAAAVAAGMAVPVGALAAAYYAVYGLRPSDYLDYVGKLGFEWRLLPLQWVTLVLDPQPMLPAGHGMISVFPFIASGLAGLAACLASPPGGASRAAHLVVAAAVVSYGAVYLCFRDLHPPALWLFYNYHYFKWLLPVFGLYTVFLANALFRLPGLAAAAATLAVLLPWRVELVMLDEPRLPPPAGRRLELPEGFGVGSVVVAAAEGSFDTIYNGVNDYYFGPRWFGASGSVAAYPVTGGLMLAPLRELGPGPGAAVLDPGVHLDPEIAPRLGQVRLRYGWPCYLPWAGPQCEPSEPFPPPVRAPGKPVVFDAGAGPLLAGDGWGPGTADALWTVGGRARLRVRIEPAPIAAELVVEAGAFVPAGSEPLDVAMRVNGVERGRWRLPNGPTTALRAALPAGSLNTDGVLTIEFRLGNPRRPFDWMGTADLRPLGLLVRSVTVQPVPTDNG